MLDIPYELKEPSEERELIHAASQQQIPSLPMMNLMEQESTITNEHTPERKSLLKKKTVKRNKQIPV